MFLDKLHHLRNLTESAHIGEDLLESSGVSELERKCLVVKQVVQDGDFPLEKALDLYEVSLEQYFGFLMMKTQKVKIHMDAVTIGSLVKIVLGFMDDTSSTRLDDRTKRLVEDMRQLSAAG